MTVWGLRSMYPTALLCGCLLVVGCASSTVTMERHRQRTVAQLQYRTDADSLAAAGLLQATKNRAQALDFSARAEAAEPTRADLVWLHLRLCQQEIACDPQPDELKLQTLSPSNGAGWLGALQRAVHDNDDTATDAALAAIAHTAHVDIYWTTLIGRLSTAAARTGNMSLDESMITVIGLVSAMAVPAYSPATHSCQGDRLQRDDLREVCRGVAQAFENGDTVITEMIGVAIAKRVWPEGSDGWNAALERRRVYEYRTALWQPLQPVTWGAPATRQFVALCLDNGSEQAVMRAQLMAAGKAPDPPPS